MVLAPSRRQRSQLPLLFALLLLIQTGCALDAPRPSPPVCPQATDGCAGPDAPWYRQSVTDMIPPPPAEPPTAPAANPGTALFEDTPPRPSVPLTDPTLPPSSTIAQDVLPLAAPTTITPSAASPAPARTEYLDHASQAVVRTRPPEILPEPMPEPSIRIVWTLSTDRLFEIGRLDLLRSGATAIDALADQLHGTPYERVVVVDHADRSGKDMSTLKLSWQRARIVRDHLASRGIPETALDHEGRGARGARIDPRRCTGPRTVRARCLAPDRRVEIAVTKRVQP